MTDQNFKIKVTNMVKDASWIKDNKNITMYNLFQEEKLWLDDIQYNNYISFVGNGNIDIFSKRNNEAMKKFAIKLNRKTGATAIYFKSLWINFDDNHKIINNHHIY